MTVFDRFSAGVKRSIRQSIDKRVARRAPKRWAQVRGGLVVLTYHRVLPRRFNELAIVEPGMYVFEDTFELHLKTIRDYFQPVDLAEWIKRREAGEPVPDRAIAVTFDDGWADNFEYAFPQLKAANVPATIFVVSGLVGTKNSFWPERLARRIVALSGSQGLLPDWLCVFIRDARVDLKSLDHESISRVIAVAKRESDVQLHDWLGELDDEYGAVTTAAAPDLLDWERLSEMTASGVVQVGSHTRSHLRMNDGVSTKRLEEEIVGSAVEIRDKCGVDPELFCFPNGDTTAESRALVEQTYLGACTTDVGWNSTATSPYGIRRIGLHQDRSDTRDALLARIVTTFD